MSTRPCCGGKRPTPTLAQVASAAAAILTSDRVPPDVTAARMEICKRCEYVRRNSVGYRWCSLCGCKVDGRKGLLNLASYEEGDGVTMTHGCHHPQRAHGKGWPAVKETHRRGAESAEGRTRIETRNP